MNYLAAVAFQRISVNCATLPVARNVNPFICARVVIDRSVVSAARLLTRLHVRRLCRNSLSFNQLLINIIDMGARRV